MCSRLIAGLALAAAVAAQVPQGFLPDITTNLNVTFSTSSGTNTVSPPGERIPRSDTANAPSFALPSNVTSTTGRAVLLMIDVDVLRNDSRVPLLHWLAPNITFTSPSDIYTQQTFAPPADGPPAPYRQPSPPAGDIPHRYIFLLFSQPSDFAIPSSFHSILQTRVGFDYTDFIAQTNLTDNGIAANYITVQNTTAGAATTTYPSTGAALPGTVTSTASSTASGNSTAGGAGSGSSAPAGGSATTTTEGGGGSPTESPAASQTTAGAVERGRTSLGAAMAGLLGMFVMFG